MKKIALLTLVALPLLFVLINYTAAQGPTPKPDFIINCDRSTVAAPPGTTVKFDLTITPVNGFVGPVELSCPPMSPKVACSMPVKTIELGATLSVPFSVTATSQTEAAIGTYPIEVVAKGTYGSTAKTGTVSHQYTLHLTLVPREP